MEHIDKRKRIDFRTVHRVEETLSLAQDLYRIVQHQFEIGAIDEYSFLICSNIESLASAQVHLMCLFSLRYSEISQIDPAKIKSQTDFRILQKKTGKMRVLFHPEVPKNFYYRFREDLVNLDLVSYDGIKGAINRAIPQHLKDSLASNHSSTHIFRHLRASWMKSLGESTELIQTYFAHESIEATAKYIHPELFQNRATNNKN